MSSIFLLSLRGGRAHPSALASVHTMSPYHPSLLLRSLEEAREETPQARLEGHTAVTHLTCAAGVPILPLLSHGPLLPQGTKEAHRSSGLMILDLPSGDHHFDGKGERQRNTERPTDK